MRLPPIAALPLLLIPLVLALVFSQLGQPPQGPGVQVRPPPEADYYLREAELLAMGEDGQLLYRVRAANVLHFPDDTVRLEGVQVDYLDGPWELVAVNGLMTPGATRLDLSGDVHMQGTLQSSDQIELDTPHLSVFFEERRIDTDAPVQLRSGQFAARAVGMRTDLDGRQFALAADVRVRYEP